MDFRSQSSSLCIHPFASLTVHATGHVTRCMMSEESMGKVSGAEGSLPHQLFQNEKMSSLRKKMLTSQWDGNCRSCIRKENDGITSKRQHWQNINATKDLWNKSDIFNPEGSEHVYFLNIAFNNYCNFKCRMCSSAYSSKWVQDEKLLKQKGLRGGSGTWSDKKAVLLGESMRSLDDKVIENIVSTLRHVRKIDVVGGEPFFSKDFLYFNRLMNEKKYGSSARIAVTTNGSIFNQDYLQSLLLYKEVEINISVDGINKLFNYIRAGKAITWEEFNQNIDRIIAFCEYVNSNYAGKKWKVNLNSAFQIYNALDFYNFIDWVEEKFSWKNKKIEFSSKLRNSFEKRVLMTPSHLSVKAAPTGILKKSLSIIKYTLQEKPYLADIREFDYIKDIVKVLERSLRLNNDKEKKWHIFNAYTNALDDIRNQSYEDSLESSLVDEINNYKLSSIKDKNEKFLETKTKWGAEFCPMPWEALSITAQGKVKPCCQMRGNFESLHDSDISNIYNSKTISKVRKEFIIENKPEACSSCWEREEQIGHSRRKWFYGKFKDNIKNGIEYSDVILKKPQWLQMDINLSNRCNLKCRMCGVWGSHKWIEDEKRLAQDGNPFKREMNPSHLALKELTLEKLESLLPHMQKVKRIDFKGGEPMLAKNHIPFLEMLIDRKINENVILHYTTNGTVINQKILKVLSQFKQVELVFSIEGTDPLYTYIRGDGQYTTKDLIKNLTVYDQLDNIKIMTNVSMQAYNLPNLLELYNFLHSLPLKNYSPKKSFQCIVNSPKYLSPFIWPLEIRNKYAQQLERIGEFKTFAQQLQTKPFEPKHYSQFLQFTKKLDDIRSENYFSIYPELLTYDDKHFEGLSL